MTDIRLQEDRLPEPSLDFEPYDTLVTVPVEIRDSIGKTGYEGETSLRVITHEILFTKM